MRYRRRSWGSELRIQLLDRFRPRRRGKLIARAQHEADLPRDLVDLNLPSWAGEDLEGVAQGHRAELVLSRRQWPGVEDVHMTGVCRAQRVTRAAHHVLHGVLDARVHARRDGYVDDLGHQVALTGIRLGADQGVAPVAHDGLFLRLHAVWIQVRGEQVWIAAAVEGWPGRLSLVGRAAGEQQAQRESGQLPGH
ncbi:hypothetical protein Z046_21495 [Pseudomonas aeruginosa VRFPA09]|nr:hypothetical protein Z046_21495 [Pseudomonas aeruginosa VRFPA09]KYQ66467.1 hypothetical protein AXH09_27645 [Pseudomonas aeruginosa]